MEVVIIAEIGKNFIRAEEKMMDILKEGHDARVQTRI